MTTLKYYNEGVVISIFVYEGHFILLCGRICKFLDFPQDIRAFPEAHIGRVPAGENRGVLYE